MSLAGAGASRHPSPFSIFISWHLLTGWAWGFADEPESVQFRVDHVSEEGSFRKTFTEVDSVLASTIADVAQEESVLCFLRGYQTGVACTRGGRLCSDRSGCHHVPGTGSKLGFRYPVPC